MIVIMIIWGVNLIGQIVSDYQSWKWREEFYKSYPPAELNIVDSTPHMTFRAD